MFLLRKVTRRLVLLTLVTLWPGGTCVEAGAANLGPASGTPLLSAYEMDACANALADALRLSKLVGVAGGPVRLLLPKWRNRAGLEVGDTEALVRRLCLEVNERTGAAVAFTLDAAPGPRLWDDRSVSRLPTYLTLARGKRHRTVELVLEVADSSGATRFVEVRHRIRLSPREPAAEDAKQRQGAAKSQGGSETPRRVERRPSSDQPAGQGRRSEPVREQTEGGEVKRSDKIRECRLSHFWAMPEDDEVEREVELGCGRLLFLDRKAAERLVHMSATCRHRPDGVLTVRLEVACRKKKREIQVWAEFFDAEGRGVNRIRTRELDFREGQIRTFTLDSVVPAEQVVVFIEKD